MKRKNILARAIHCLIAAGALFFLPSVMGSARAMEGVPPAEPAAREAAAEPATASGPTAEETQGQTDAPPIAADTPTTVGARSRFVSFRSDFVNMREGPSTEHRVKWIYHRQGLPVQVLAEYDVWRRVRDMDGEVGWVHVALLSGDRTTIVIGEGHARARSDADPDAPLIAEVEPGVVGRILACEAISCRVDFAGIAGWIDRERLWGVYADEHL
jgi:SH3-like domain-containing protein